MISVQIILDDVVDLKNIECLNQKEDHSVANLFADSDAFLESDCDEQLIIALNFKTALKIHSLVFTNTVRVCPCYNTAGALLSVLQ